VAVLSAALKGLDFAGAVATLLPLFNLYFMVFKRPSESLRQQRAI
jgi:hypothetical protein